MMRKFLNSILTLIVFMFGSALFAQTVEDVKEAIDAFETALDLGDLEELEKQYNRLGEYAEKKSALFADYIDRWNGLYARYQVVLAEAEENATLVADAGSVTTEDVNQAIDDLEAAADAGDVQETERIQALLVSYSTANASAFTQESWDEYRRVYNDKASPVLRGEYIANTAELEANTAELEANTAELEANTAELEANTASNREKIAELKKELDSLMERQRKILVRRKVLLLEYMNEDLDENPNRTEWSSETKEKYEKALLDPENNEEDAFIDKMYNSIGN